MFASSFEALLADHESRVVAARDADVVSVPIPALALVLLNKEQQKGSPLTRREVESLGYAARRMTLPRKLALALQARRGYADIDLDNCWEDWSTRRAELARSNVVAPCYCGRQRAQLERRAA